MVLVSTVFKAVLTRLIFAAHAMVAIFWVTNITKDEQLWHLSWILVGLLIETLLCLFYRRGDEYKWVSASIVCYLAATVPCAWLIELHMLSKRLAETKTTSNAGTQNTTVSTQNGSPIQISEENFTDLIEQTTMLMMILGRWLLPKGSLTRESLSQLLLVNLAMSADIIEFFDILKLSTARTSVELTLAILCLWTISLLQFPVNATAKLGDEINNKEQEGIQTTQVSPRLAQKTKTTSSLPNYIQRHGRRTSRVSVDYSFRQAPLSDRKLSLITSQRRPSQLFPQNLETGDVLTNLPGTTNQKSRARRGSLTMMERTKFPDAASRGRVNGRMSVDVGSLLKSTYTDYVTSKDILPNEIPCRFSRDFQSSSSSRAQPSAEIEGGTVRKGHTTSQDSNGMPGTSEEEAPKHRVTMDLIGTLMALFMQDGPFLTFRLYMIAKHSAFEYMIVFLTVKNALLLTLQVYRLCVLHCVCHDHKDNDFSPENQVDAMSRLNNVQIAVVNEQACTAKKPSRMRSRYNRLSVRWSRINKKNIQS